MDVSHNSPFIPIHQTTVLFFVLIAGINPAMLLINVGFDGVET